MTWFSPKFLAYWGECKPTFAEIFAITGDIYRAPEGTQRRTLRFERGGKGFFLKLHWGIGWREIFKNLTSLRLPVLGASNEWQAIWRLEQLRVETMQLVGYGQEGRNPARLRSFVITEELANCISLEDYCRDWPQSPPDFALKLKLITRIAGMSRRLHNNGVNHRDFYICHFLLQCPWDGRLESLHLHLIDLHRVQIRPQTPERWLVKDVGSLYFSAMDIGLTQRDLLRFLRLYYKCPLRQILKEKKIFLQAVQKRADALYRTRPLPTKLMDPVGRCQKQRWGKYQAKLFRECTDFICRQNQGRFEIIVRNALSPALESILADPDSSFPGEEQALKNGNTCTVWATKVDDLSLVIKRYNVKGPWHGLKLATTKGRAFISWENAHRLVFYGIATPRPVALVKIKRGLLKPMSYFIAEQIDGVGAQEWFKDESISWALKIAMAEKINQLFLQLEAQRISHGDLKASNILIVADRPVLVDLDAMQQHTNNASFRKSQGKDMRRFMRNWDDKPVLQGLFKILPTCDR